MRHSLGCLLIVSRVSSTSDCKCLEEYILLKLQLRVQQDALLEVERDKSATSFAGMWLAVVSRRLASSAKV